MFKTDSLGRLRVGILVSLLVGWSTTVHAQGSPAVAPTAAPSPATTDEARSERGYVLAVQDEDIIVDLSGGQGVSAGTEVQLWRPLKLKHPITGKTLNDRFLIGTLTLTQVRDNLSMARAVGALARPPAPGDIVISHVRARSAPPAAELAHTSEQPPSSTAVVAPAAEDADARAVAALLEQARGESPQGRVALYIKFVKANRGNRYTPALLDQTRQLNALARTMAAPQGPEVKRHLPPDVALIGHDLSLGVQLEGVARALVLHFKAPDESTFVTLPMNAAGATFYSGVVPGAAVTPGGLEYFVEAVDSEGEARALVGTPTAPVKVSTRYDFETKDPKRPTATAHLVTDFADYNRLKGNDRSLQIEMDFGLRLGDRGLRALRSGFGVYRGVGGALDELDELGKSPRKTGLTYGYLEAEFAGDGFALIARPLLGLGDEGVRGGLQAHVRIGSDRETNVTLGGELLGDVGVRGITQLTISPESRIPIVLRSEVGNQPAGVASDPTRVRPQRDGESADGTSLSGSDVGVRGIVQVGYRLLPELVVGVRASYQGRNIKHSGPGVGGSVEYSW